mmetsp:Transcript_12924/g.24447  ORF Transcript_12924/g.24447 Transcript_12924/m.24447 type:complete len:421 (+) Transcript_12924:94-1356(+)|eukprot:CAMPEP_0197475762 /NCGR_PEP_ID=MMETSP1309-20131121/7185_1 /TAXON_ID=464262 /ORGANISM="Genus nov. species nov., Strain RCC998" /LENGTH=420 /DNA_ID=CAMNT_0043015879 /DNA_START=87 /DNA_END=1349 /DNA_ORIENTATION=-
MMNAATTTTHPSSKLVQSKKKIKMTTTAATQQAARKTTTATTSKRGARHQQVAARAAAPQTVSPASSLYPPTSESDVGTMTFTTWLLRQEMQSNITNEMAVVLSSIALACKQISSLVTRSSLSGMTGLAGGAQNIQGEDQKKLDVISNDIFSECLKNCGRTGTIASEEEDIPVAIDQTFSGDYVVCFDPLDGSSNIDAGISVGSIFGIFEPNEECNLEGKNIVTESTDGDDLDISQQEALLHCCRPGKDLLSAGYVMYSSSTVLVLTVGDGVYGFTLDTLIGDFVLSHHDIKIPESGKIYSFNEGNLKGWSDGLKEYMDFVKEGDKPYSARYIGSLVGDFHRTMLYGGVYGYPGDVRNVNGKLRLLYECAPMSFLAEQAGGKGSTGTGRVLDIVPDQVHQRCPLFIGSTKEVELIEKFLV